MIAGQRPQLWRIDGGQLQLSFHAGQSQAWRATWQRGQRFVFIFAGTQSGKTSFGPWWLWQAVRTYGQGDYLAVTASYDLFKLKLLPELRTVFESTIGWQVNGPAMGRFWSGSRLIELRDPATNQFWAKKADDPMWGRIILRSASSDGGLEAATAHAAWLDECGMDSFTLEDWEAVQRRLSLSQGPVLGTTTLYNIGWVKSEIYEPWLAGDGEIQVIQYPSYVNPAFPREEYDRMRERLPSWRFAMFYDGEFARPAGLIYNAVTEAMFVTPFRLPPQWKRGVGIDFGGANTAIVWAARDPATDIWYIYQEWLGGGGTTREYARRAREGLLGAREFTAAGGAGSESQERRDWTEAGFKVEQPSLKSVELGISNVIEFVKTDRFRVFDSCKGLSDEIGSYRRKLDDSGQPTDEIVDKRHYHRLDAVRYLFSNIARPGSRQVKSMRG